MHARPLLLAFVFGLLDCATLDKIPSGPCGNGVIDAATEDCDTFDVAGHQCGKSGVQACRLLCGRPASPPDRPNADPACPPGWGCSVDGYCRQPTEKFDGLTDPLSSDVVSMQVGDFDGDLRKDILASGARGGDNAARVKVHYFGAGGALEHVTSINARISSPEVRDFDGDGKDDLAFGVVDVVSGVDVMRGQSDRRLVPLTMPSQRFPATSGFGVFVYGQGQPTPDRAVTSLDPTTLLVVGSTQGQNVIASQKAADGGPALAVVLPAPPTAYVAEPQWATILSAADANAGTCGQVVVASNFTDDAKRQLGRIDILSPCRGRKWTSDAKPTIELQLNEPLDTGLLVADVDGDSFTDLVFATAQRLFFVKGDGTSASLALEKAKILLRGPNGQPSVPLAVGDLNGDAVPDIVFPEGVFASNAPVTPPGGDAGASDAGAGAPDASAIGGATLTAFGHTYFFAAPSPRGRWTSAVIADFNDDKLPDLVGGSSEASDLDFFLNTNVNPRFVLSTIPTTGPALTLRGGDFDGDGLLDLAIAQAQPQNGDRCPDNLATPVDIAYAYGKANGPPETPLVVAHVDDFASMPALAAQSVPQGMALIGYERDDTSPTPCTAPKTLTLGILLGSGDRLPLSPLLFEIPNGLEITWRPLVVHTGPFVGKIPASPLADIFSLAVKQDASSLTPRVALWTSPNRGTALRFDPPVEDKGSETFLTQQAALIDVATRTFRAASASGDLDQDGYADIAFVVQQNATGKSSLGTLYGGNGDPSSPPKAPPTEVELDARYVVGADSRATLADVDGDGFQDLLLVLTDGGSRKQRRALVMLNAKGTLDPKPIEIPIPSTADDSPTAIAPLTITAADTTGAGAKKGLVVVTDRKLYFVTLKSDKSGFDIVTQNVPPASFAGATDVVVADFDGDGVDDIAIADSGGIRLLKRRGRLE